MFRLSILSIILTVVAAGCGPAATTQPTDVPVKRTPESSDLIKTRVPTLPETATTPPIVATTPREGRSDANPPVEPVVPDGLEILDFVPEAWLDGGVWISNQRKAVESAGAPDARTVEEFFSMDEEERAKFSDALLKSLPGGFITGLRQSPREWKVESGLDLFGLSSTAGVGTTSKSPRGPVVLLGEVNDSEIIEKLLDAGYEPRAHWGQEYYVVGNDSKIRTVDSLLVFSRINGVYVSRDLVVVSRETASMEEFLDLLVGKTRPLRDRPLALAAIGSLGETFAAAVLTRDSIFNPVASAPLTYDKPPVWGTLAPWEILAAGSGVQDGQPFFAFSIAFDDPTGADSNLSEVKARVESYHTLAARPRNGWLVKMEPEPDGDHRFGPLRAVTFPLPEHGPSCWE